MRQKKECSNDQHLITVGSTSDIYNNAIAGSLVHSGYISADANYSEITKSIPHQE